MMLRVGRSVCGGDDGCRLGMAVVVVDESLMVVF